MGVYMCILFHVQSEFWDQSTTDILQFKMYPNKYSQDMSNQIRKFLLKSIVISLYSKLVMMKMFEILHPVLDVNGLQVLK